MNILEFAGQHPWITLLCVMVTAHMPVAIIRELRRAPFQSKNNDHE